MTRKWNVRRDMHLIRTRVLTAVIALAGLASPGRAADGLPTYFEYSPDQAVETEPALTPREQIQLEAELRERARLDRTVWASERMAQEHEAPFVDLWDRLRAARQPFDVATTFEIGEIVLPAYGPGRALDDGVTLLKPAGTAGATLVFAEWTRRLAGWRKAGWKIVQTEWHHAEFHRESIPPWSTVRINIHVTAPDGARHEWRGAIRVTWREPAKPGDRLGIAAVDAGKLDHIRRPAAPAFKKVFEASFKRVRDQGSTMLHAWDLDGDGRSELVLPGVNAVFRNNGKAGFKKEALLAHPVFPDPCGLFADFDGDGRTDYLCTGGTPQKLLLYRGGARGTFPGRPVEATSDALDLRAGAIITAGDVDGDGHADVWIGQYRNPYMGGQFPTPYYDANDGYPCYLLKGDGTGRFTDITATAGFDAKRHRRNYCAVLLDFFGNGRLDLITVNDFAGVDVWRNDGNGRFTDATPAAVSDPMNFGMGIAVDDFAGNATLGFYVSGMGSTTMRRLSAMGLRPATGYDVTLSRTRMGYGNRLYLREAPGVYREPAWNDLVSRSGWSWGTVGFDPDLDGDRDLYIVNGFISGRTSWDYCTTFWCHDVYTKRDLEPRLVRHLLAVSTAEINRGETSWNGFEKNRFFMKSGASEYVEAGWPLGLAFEEDCRNLVADDLDGDGKPDLAFLYEAREPSGNPGAGSFGLRVMRNELPTAKRHWIGVRVKAAVPFGAVVRIRTPSGVNIGAVVSGDSWRSQQAPVRHFGLGASDTVDAIEVTWPGGAVTTLDRPKAGRYHDLTPPAK